VVLRRVHLLRGALDYLLRVQLLLTRPSGGTVDGYLMVAVALAAALTQLFSP